MRTSDTPAGRLEVLVVPGMERAVGHVRRWLRDVVGPEHPTLYDFTVCAAEVMTNAIKYTDSGSGGRIRVEVTIAHDHLLGEITDDGGALTVPHLQPADGQAVSGRGLVIVDDLADDWDAERRDGPGFTVWFMIRH